MIGIVAHAQGWGSIRPDLKYPWRAHSVPQLFIRIRIMSLIYLTSGPRELGTYVERGGVDDPK